MNADTLRALADQAEATHTSSNRWAVPMTPDESQLIKAVGTPDAARLLADAADFLKDVDLFVPGEPNDERNVLLARFAGLGAPQQEETP